MSTATPPSIPVQCPCGQQFTAEPHLAGKKVDCPTCGRPFLVPQVKERAPATPELALDDSSPFDESSMSPLATPTRKKKAAPARKTPRKKKKGGMSTTAKVLIGLVVAFLSIPVILIVIVGIMAGIRAMQPWESYNLSGPGVTISFPEKPSNSGPGSFRAPPMMSDSIQQAYLSRGQDAGFWVVARRLTDAESRAPGLLQGFRNSSMARGAFSGGEVSDRQITVEGQDALELTFRDRNGTYAGKGRMVIYNGWLIMWIAGGQGVRKSEVNRFMSSFQVQ